MKILGFIVLLVFHHMATACHRPVLPSRFGTGPLENGGPWLYMEGYERKSKTVVIQVDAVTGDKKVIWRNSWKDGFSVFGVSHNAQYLFASGWENDSSTGPCGYGLASGHGDVLRVVDLTTNSTGTYVLPGQMTEMPVFHDGCVYVLIKPYVQPEKQRRTGNPFLDYKTAMSIALVRVTLKSGEVEKLSLGLPASDEIAGGFSDIAIHRDHLYFRYSYSLNPCVFYRWNLRDACAVLIGFPEHRLMIDGSAPLLVPSGINNSLISVERKTGRTSTLIEFPGSESVRYFVYDLAYGRDSNQYLVYAIVKTGRLVTRGKLYLYNCATQRDIVVDSYTDFWGGRWPPYRYLGLTAEPVAP